MSHSLAQFRTQRDTALQDAASKLATGDRDALLLQAILQRYSSDKPREIVTDVASTGTSDLPLPTDAAATFEDGYSTVETLEYPIGLVPASVLLDEEWTMYRSPSGLVIRSLATTIPNGTSARVTWTARHKDDGSTVPDQDFEAVCDYAAGLCFDALAATYAQTGDPTIQADTVNYRSKSQEYQGLAKAAKKRYFDHVGAPDGAQGPGNVAVISTGSIHEDLQGLDRLTHPRATR